MKGLPRFCGKIKDMPVALRIRGVGKRYPLGGGRASDSLRETVSRFLLRRERRQRPTGELWALRDVSFDIQQGQVVGIIGRNGAGKSTLLKILSRITAPTVGEIDIYGKIAGLLEVGTGFHPELTGRENIFLNGSILGMPRALIRERFDEIVAFAEIERFLDSPVKHYSSGMYVRLAFSVAAHLDSDILLLDEVLAVGDIGFQKKCLAKMENVVHHGRTVIFVSHSMTAIRQLCPRTLLIDSGRLVADGPTAQTLRTFSESLRKTPLDATTHLKERLEGHSGAVRFTRFALEDTTGKERYDYQEGEPIRVRVDYQVFDAVPDLVIYFALNSESTGDVVTSTRYTLSEKPLAPGFRGTARIEFPVNSLLAREYHPYVWLGSRFGLPFDRINTSLTSCPPLIILPRQLGPEQPEGYFTMPSRLIAG
jgi:lipopolysaccharide transport system ATP-binding protein